MPLTTVCLQFATEINPNGTAKLKSRDISKRSLSTAYTTVPMYGEGPGRLIFPAPPEYAIEEKKTVLLYAG
ncbi:hypothetical protein DPMN_113574 [Dreissena polymorpha]|uniref:Uncharacterized protein n=1 Tax=Dreissena polymorpha TaxID=45954 RepID=A0A9D4KIG2_DREPO|nr:hypothetical protein DPMN_113574 [Dreissena polymorpha]